MRKYFIDNIRWINIMLLFPYHTFMIYNNFGENFYVKSEGIPLLTSFIRITYPWFMPLMFVLAGISSCYALNRRTPKQYLKERLLKLFIPFLSGILLLIPIQTYYAERFHNGYSSGYFHQYILFFAKGEDLTGYTGGFTPAHLWFILYLFIISLVALPITIKYKNSKKKVLIKKLSVLKILPMFLIFLVMALFLDMGGKSLGEYFALFMLGYIILSEDAIQIKLDKNRWYLLAGLVILTTLNLMFQSTWRNSFRTAYDIFIRFHSWVGILAILGMGKHHLNFHNKATNYFSKASFPIYVFHQSFVVLTGYYALKITTSITVQVIAILLGSFALTMLTYEMFKRLSFTRVLFGVKE